MNDRSEFTYGSGLLRTLAEERLNASSSDFDRAILKLVIDGEPSIEYDAYLTCFCETGDLLSQWRGYGTQDSRYCIEFEPSKFDTALGTPSPVIRVVYEPKVQRELLTRILEEHLRGAEALADLNTDNVALYRLIVRCLYVCAFSLIAFFKDPAFHEEAEWRSMLFVKRSEYADELEFTSSGGMMKPSLPIIKGEGGMLPVVRVIAGASRGPQQSTKAAKLMLTKFGYSGVPVDTSRVPLSA
jgi:hypothetical protein